LQRSVQFSLRDLLVVVKMLSEMQCVDDECWLFAKDFKRILFILLFFAFTGVFVWNYTLLYS
jgi:hypothetical protein